MAVVKYRKRVKAADGTYNTVYCETLSSLVLRPDGTSVEDTLKRVLLGMGDNPGTAISSQSQVWRVINGDSRFPLDYCVYAKFSSCVNGGEYSLNICTNGDRFFIQQTADGAAPTSGNWKEFLPKSGGQLTGALTFANSTLNLVGDDCYLGDQDRAGCVCIKGNNGETGLCFIGYSNAGTNNTIRYNEGHGLYVQGTVEPEYATLKNIQGSTTDIGAGASLSTGYIYLVYE